MKPDGRKRNQGQHLKKDESLKRKQVTIYEVSAEIEELGGMEAVREILHKAFRDALSDKRIKDLNKEFDDHLAKNTLYGRRLLDPNSAT